MYVIARTATQNPDINGRTLYLTAIGFWSLDLNNAVNYVEKTEAEKKLLTYPEAHVQTYRGDE